MKEKVGDGGDYVEFIDPTIREKYVEDIKVILEWIDNEGENAPLVDYQERLTKLTTIGDPVIVRNRFIEL